MRVGSLRELVLVNLGKGPAFTPSHQLRSGAREQLAGLKNSDSSNRKGTKTISINTIGGGAFALNGRNLQCQDSSLTGHAYWTVVDFHHADNERLIATRFYPS